MPAEHSPDVKLEIGHVLFIDIVGYSKGLINEQSELLQKLKEIVRGTEQFRAAEAEGKLLRLPTGDGGALVFRNSPEAPVLCAMEIAKALKGHPELRVRMGIHSGPVNEISDLNEQANIAGAGINLAQRVTDCGDAGHILLSKHVAEDLEHYPRWQPYLHDLGEVEVKHGVRIGIVNFCGDQLGNPALPGKIAARRQEQTTASQVEEKRSSRKRRLLSVTFLAITAAAIAVSIIAYRMSRQLNQEQLVRKAASLIPEKSVAVLPFENLSEEKANAYFADGIQDEILTRLSKIADLKVISRTSTQHYKSAPENLSEIARQLGVANILEGSVQKSGEAVRVNVQLIKAANDSHLWADTFDRKLTDIFSVESEVAKAIADKLRAKLTGQEEQVIAAKPTDNPAAYDAYLRGLGIQHNQLGFSAETNAAKAYDEAVRIDPGFALAWAHLAMIRSPLYLYDIDLKTNSAESIREAADKAMALQPELAEAWAAQGAYRYRVARDFSGALQAYEEAHKRFPNSSQILLELSVIETRLGRWDVAEGHFRRALELDPRSPGLLGTVAIEFLGRMRRFSEAEDLINRALAISPDDQWFHVGKAGLFQYESRLDEAAKELARLPTDSIADFVVAARVDYLIWQRQFDTAIALIQRKLNSMTAGEPLDAWTKIFITRLGYCQEWAGRPDEAKDTFARALHEIKPSDDAVVSPKGFGMPIYLALAYAGLGEKEKALEQAHRAVEEYANDGWVKPDAEGALAQIQARFGDVDSAIAALPHLLQVPAGITPADLRFNPFWDPLRNDPRFQKILASPEPKVSNN
jgi:TolB-like protein/Tfp pilus assembly protein PilF